MLHALASLSIKQTEGAFFTIKKNKFKFSEILTLIFTIENNKQKIYKPCITQKRFIHWDLIEKVGMEGKTYDEMHDMTKMYDVIQISFQREAKFLHFEKKITKTNIEFICNNMHQ